jgi:hypothetical protein
MVLSASRVQKILHSARRNGTFRPASEVAKEYNLPPQAVEEIYARFENHPTHTEVPKLQDWHRGKGVNNL